MESRWPLRASRQRPCRPYRVGSPPRPLPGKPPATNRVRPGPPELLPPGPEREDVALTGVISPGRLFLLAGIAVRLCGLPGGPRRCGGRRRPPRGPRRAPSIVVPTFGEGLGSRRGPDRRDCVLGCPRASCYCSGTFTAAGVRYHGLCEPRSSAAVRRGAGEGLRAPLRRGSHGKNRESGKKSGDGVEPPDRNSTPGPPGGPARRRLEPDSVHEGDELPTDHVRSRRRRRPWHAPCSAAAWS